MPAEGFQSLGLPDQAEELKRKEALLDERPWGADVLQAYIDKQDKDGCGHPSVLPLMSIVDDQAANASLCMRQGASAHHLVEHAQGGGAWSDIRACWTRDILLIACDRAQEEAGAGVAPSQHSQ